MGKTKSTDLIDPLADAIQNLPPDNRKLLQSEPIHSWLLGLAELKISVGRRLSWPQVQERLHMSCVYVTESKNPSANIGGKVRKLTEAERDACCAFTRAAPLKDGLRAFIQDRHPGLYKRLARG